MHSNTCLMTNFMIGSIGVFALIIGGFCPRGHAAADGHVLSDFDPRPRIINGEAVDPKFSFPFMSSLTDAMKHVCGGTLIAPDIVLTAAHCAQSFGAVQMNRHDIRDDAETYEMYVVEKIVTHPRHYSNFLADSDPHDVAVVKLFGSSQIQPIPLMKKEEGTADDSRLRKGDALMALGWGRTIANDPTPSTTDLQQTTVYYIPNDECKHITGVFRDINITYSNRVIDVTLCAMNSVDATDTCQGDSGGPLLFLSSDDNGTATGTGITTGTSTNAFDPQRPSQEQFVQAGITSAGFGCAHPTLPGLYARVSNVRQWIHETICRESEYASHDYGCVGEHPSILNDGSSTPKWNEDVDMVTLRIQHRLDVSPHQRGWALRMLQKEADGGPGQPVGMSAGSIRHQQQHGATTGSPWITIAYQPIFSYNITQQYQIVTDYVSVPDDRQYVLTVLDSYGDGHRRLRGELDMMVIDNRTDTVLFDSDAQQQQDGKRHTGYSYDAAFIVGNPPTLSPTITTLPTTSTAPTSAPTQLGEFVSLQINFAAQPYEIGYKLERRLVNGEYEVLQVAYPGTYSSFDYFHGSVVERLPLRILVTPDSPPPATRTFRFTMTSNEGHGFRQKGNYTVWYGDVGSGEFLFSGGDFGLEIEHVFDITPKPWSQPLTAQPTTRSASSTQPPTDQPTAQATSSSTRHLSSVGALLCAATFAIVLPF